MNTPKPKMLENFVTGWSEPLCNDPLHNFRQEEAVKLAALSLDWMLLETRPCSSVATWPI